MATSVNRGGPPFFRPFIKEYTLSGLTALAGGGQSGATLCKAGINTFSTVANANDSCVLPTTVEGSGGAPIGARGANLVVINIGANNLAVFPAVGDSIDGQAANTSVVLPPNTIGYFTAAYKNNWYASYAGFGGIMAAAQKTVAANPGSIASTTMQMAGLAGSITPLVTGRVEITICGDVTQSTTADGAKWQISYGTGAAPANAAALTGTQVGANPTMTFLTGVLTVPFSTSVLVTGLTRNTAYWIDLALGTVTGGSASVSNVSITACEV